MFEIECRFSCPNCRTDAVVQVPGKAKCTGLNCNYIFQVFSKRDKEGAQEFYLTQPSKKWKYILESEDGRWLVAFCDKAEPFIADNLFDLIDPEVLQTIQIGLSERLKQPMTIVVMFKEHPKQKNGHDFPVQIIEKDGRLFGRVDPIDPLAYRCKRCKKIRDFPEGDKTCFNYDMNIAREMLINDKPASMWRLCWAGLVDYALPVIINNFTSAVFFTGQIYWTDEKGRKGLDRGSEEVAKIVSLEKEELLRLIDDKDQLKANEAQLNQKLKEYEALVRTIRTVSANRYWVERRVREAEFLTEIFIFFTAVSDEIQLWKVLKVVLQRLNEFSFFRYSAFLLSSEDSENIFNIMAADGIPITRPQTFQVTSIEINKIFQREALFPVKESGQTKDNELYTKILNFLGVENINCALLFPCKIGANRNGLIILAERIEVIPGCQNTGRVSKRRKDFLERVAHGIRIEVQNVLTITELKKSLEEKDDLMDKAGHLLVLPLDSAYGKTEHLITIVSGSDPAIIIRNATKIRELCQSIDKDIVHCILRIRSFMFFSTIKTKSEEYRFDKAISLVQLLKECTDDFQSLAKKRGCTIELNEPDDLPLANFDKDKMGIVFSNLLDNAVKYSHANKTIRVNISYDIKEDIYTISVSDFGISIPMSDFNKIFEKYYRSELKDPRRVIPGTGIGLTVAKQIVTKHSGKIWVTSKQGATITGVSSSVEGFNTTFWVQIHRQRRKLT